MLVDTGIGVISLRSHIPVLTEKPCLAIVSYTHFDHIEGHYEFSERYVHASEANIISNPTRGSTLVRPYVTDDMFTCLPPKSYTSAEFSVKRAPATRILHGGDIIDLGNRQFKVIHTPGHSPRSIMLSKKTNRNVVFWGYCL